MKLSFAAALVATLIAAPATAYDITELTRDMRAHHERMMDDLVDLTIRQSITIQSPDAGESTLTSTMYRKGDRWRMEGTLGAGGMAGGQSVETIMVFDGSDLWSVVMGMKTKMPAAAAQGVTAADPWKEPLAGSTLAGEETVGGRACWVVESPETPAAGRATPGATRSWIDKATFALVQSETTVSGQRMRSVFSDFRDVGGYELPHTIEVYSGDQRTMTATITSIETDTGLSDELFDPDQLAGGAGPDIEALMKQAEEMQKRMGAAGQGE